MKFLRKWGKKAFKWGVRYPAAMVLSIFVLVGGFMLIQAGVDINIGGWLRYLFGRPSGSDGVVAAANTLPDKRVHEDGSDIALGESDVNGWTQWEAKEWSTESNIFRDRSTITIDSGGTPHVVNLPIGIKDSDIDSVIEVKPRIYVVKTKTSSKHSAKELLDRLPKP